ncbi:MAG: HD domain-containing phosphohydrolase [Solirubrobacteraceae bacterium]|nr:diguanylate cyclase [Patulibacter sp.]
MTRNRIVWAGYTLVFGWLLAAVVRGLVDPHADLGPFFSRFVHDGVLAIACVLAFARVALKREERLAWALIAAGLTAWTAGEIYYTSVLWTATVVPLPSPADVGYLLMPPLVLTGLVLLVRNRMHRAPRTRIIDGLVAALAIGAISAALVFSTVADQATGKVLSNAVALAYPLLDLVLLGFVVGALAGIGWRFDRSWGTLALGVALFWAADSVYLIQTAHDAFVSDTIIDTAWWIGLTLMSAAAWIPAQRQERLRAGLRLILMPLLFASTGLALLVYGNIAHLDWLATTLAALALVATMLRLLLSFQLNTHMLHRSQGEAMTDALTGLPNRRALARDIDTLDLAEGETLVLALFDLDGFKLYNDTFGHPAGDALLQRLGHALGNFLDGRGTAYRMGGDEFCALIRPGDEVVDPILTGTAGALSEHGRGFTVTSSYGSVILPLEAADADAAMKLADQRMYAQKNAGRASAGRQSTDVLLRALAERSPGLTEHLQHVTDLAVGIAHELALTDDEISQVRVGAELHDIGKVAVPDEILHKPSALDDDEWEFIHGHALIGERIVAAAPSLRHIAPVVRATHERWDGTGYPDGLSGRVIPVAARIIAAAEAFDAMTHDLPYRARMTTEAAFSELRACAGTQFDPVVVSALLKVEQRAREAAPAGSAASAARPVR